MKYKKNYENIRCGCKFEKHELSAMDEK